MLLAGNHLIPAILAQHGKTTRFVARLVHHELQNAEVIAGKPYLAQWHRFPTAQLLDLIASDSDGVKMACSPDSDRS